MTDSLSECIHVAGGLLLSQATTHSITHGLVEELVGTAGYGKNNHSPCLTAGRYCFRPLYLVHGYAIMSDILHLVPGFLSALRSSAHLHSPCTISLCLPFCFPGFVSFLHLHLHLRLPGTIGPPTLPFDKC
jgi:hypothetical protein